EHRVAGEETAFERFLRTLLDGADVFLRHRATDDLVLEDEALAPLERFDLQFDDAVLAAATGLPDEPALGARGLGDSFAVAHLRTADIRGDLMLAEHAVDDDLEVEFAHAGDDRLAALFVEGPVEGGIF